MDSTNIKESIASPDTDTTVSWQVAFWAVFNIALNTFIQSPGTIPTLESVPGRIIRTSPWNCVVDALDIIITILINLTRGVHPARIGLAILAQRNLEPEFTTRASVWCLRLVALFLAVVPLIRLTAMQGIPYTTVCAWCYFTSWLSLEVVKALASYGQFRTVPALSYPPLSSRQMLFTASRLLQFLVPTMWVGWIFPCRDSKVPGPLLWLSAITMAPIGAIPGEYFWPVFPEVIPRTIRSAMRKMGVNNLAVVEESYLAATFVVSSVLYYTAQYDPTETYKPGWIKVLG